MVRAKLEGGKRAVSWTVSKDLRAVLARSLCE